MKTINSATIIRMVQMGATNLSNNRDLINKLNVFPVPDVDTGTNMNVPLSSGVKELNKVHEQGLDSVLTSFVKGLLMGARGNSGVILSQLFRGFSESLQGKSELTSEDFAKGLVAGVQVAYQSVTSPVEGTILTVAKDDSNKANEIMADELYIIQLKEKVLLE